MDKKKKGNSEKNEGGRSTARLQHEALFTETCIPECLQSASHHAENTRKNSFILGGFGEGDRLSLTELLMPYQGSQIPTCRQ